jgi:hypothetical protein
MWNFIKEIRRDKIEEREINLKIDREEKIIR